MLEYMILYNLVEHNIFLIVIYIYIHAYICTIFSNRGIGNEDPQGFASFTLLQPAGDTWNTWSQDTSPFGSFQYQQLGSCIGHRGPGRFTWENDGNMLGYNQVSKWRRGDTKYLQK